MEEGFGKPEIEFKSEDYHVNSFLETKEQVDWYIDRLKELKKILPSKK